MNFQTRLAAKILSLGGVISLPTDTVQGLSCLPNANFGLNKILQLKRRQTAKGLILLAPDKRFFIDFVEDKNLLNKLKIAKTPTTYLLKSSPNVSRLLRGNFDTIALRLTDNNLISQLCKATGSALVSTSANISGKPVAASLLDLRIIFKGQLDFCIAPKIGDNRPSKIINLHTGERLR